YNANPDSTSAALRSVAAMTTHGRRWAVLGAMLELGDDGPVLHAQVGTEVAELGFDDLLVVGAEAQPVADGAREASRPGPHVRTVPDADAAQELLREELLTGDVVLLKSSRDAALRWLGDTIAQEEARA